MMLLRAGGDCGSIGSFWGGCFLTATADPGAQTKEHARAMRVDNRVSTETQGCASSAPLECLDIPRASRPRYDSESPMRLPEFWAGAVASRKQMEDASENQHERASHADAIRRLESIQAEVGRSPLSAIPEYKRWLAR